MLTQDGCVRVLLGFKRSIKVKITRHQGRRIVAKIPTYENKTVNLPTPEPNTHKPVTNVI